MLLNDEGEDQKYQQQQQRQAKNNNDNNQINNGSKRQNKHATKQTNKQRTTYLDKHSTDNDPLSSLDIFFFIENHSYFVFFFLSTESNPFLSIIQQLRNLTLNELQVI